MSGAAPLVSKSLTTPDRLSSGEIQRAQLPVETRLLMNTARSTAPTDAFTVGSGDITHRFPVVNSLPAGIADSPSPLRPGKGDLRLLRFCGDVGEAARWERQRFVTAALWGPAASGELRLRTAHGMWGRPRWGTAPWGARSVPMRPCGARRFTSNARYTCKRCDMPVGISRKVLANKSYTGITKF